MSKSPLAVKKGTVFFYLLLTFLKGQAQTGAVDRRDFSTSQLILVDTEFQDAESLVSYCAITVDDCFIAASTRDHEWLQISVDMLKKALD